MAAFRNRGYKRPRDKGQMSLSQRGRGRDQDRAVNQGGLVDYSLPLVGATLESKFHEP